MCLHPDRQGAQAAAGKIRIVGRYGLAKLLRGLAQSCPIFLMRSDAAHHDVAMAHNIFGAGQDRHINALVERGMEIRRRPCVIEQSDNIMFLGRCANGGNVLHLEGQASGRFQQYRFGTITEKRLIIGGERIKIACLDAKAFQKAIR